MTAGSGNYVTVDTQDRMPIDIRDLACFGRPTRLVWNKRRWRCTRGRLRDQDLDRALLAADGHPERVAATPRKSSDGHSNCAPTG